MPWSRPSPRSRASAAQPKPPNEMAGREAARPFDRKPLASVAYLAQAAANFGNTWARPVLPTRIAVSWLLVVAVSIMSERLFQSDRFFMRPAEMTPRADEISSGGLLAVSDATTRSTAESRPTARETSFRATGVRLLPGRLRVSV